MGYRKLERRQIEKVAAESKIECKKQNLMAYVMECHRRKKRNVNLIDKKGKCKCVQHGKRKG
jgi:hypothetical protein